MKTAILVHGNLRTFFMPLRESQTDTIAARFIRHFVNQNNADVFIYTDTNDFFYNGTQYYPENRKIEILNNDSCRIHSKIDFINSDSARGILTEQLQNLIGGRLKSLNIENPYDPKIDPKYDLLYNANVIGSSPSLLIHQWRKLKLCYESLKEYEKTNDKYDIIVKWRFDIFIPNTPFLLSSYNLGNIDIYTAGGRDPIVYDWYAFGKRHAIEEYMYLYDKLGMFLSEDRAFMYECKKCHTISHFGGKVSIPCKKCGHSDLNNYEITLAPEYHLFRLFKMKNIKFEHSNYPAYPYRYGSNNRSANEMIKELGINNITLINHTANRESSITNF